MNPTITDGSNKIDNTMRNVFLYTTQIDLQEMHLFLLYIICNIYCKNGCEKSVLIKRSIQWNQILIEMI